MMSDLSQQIHFFSRRMRGDPLSCGMVGWEKVSGFELREETTCLCLLNFILASWSSERTQRR